MGDGSMQIRYKGLTCEQHGGKDRWRVRVSGDERKRLTIPVDPDHPEFHAYYHAARRGQHLHKPVPETHSPGTMGWLINAYLTHLARMVAAGQASPLTLKERRNLAAYVLAQESEQDRTTGLPYHGLPMTIPASELIALRDRMAPTPGKARNVWKLLTAAYDFGVERHGLRVNPVRAVPRPVYRSQGGAVPWSLDDLRKYREAHPAGTMAHLCLTLFMMTACRIGDAYHLGRAHEEQHNGTTWLAWQPAKAGSRLVRIPILAPLDRAIHAQKIVGATYLLTEHGKPFASPEALRNRFKKWCRAADLENRSSHGIRKAAGHLLALHGATQYEIMSVHGHANASTSQVYTDSVERMRLGSMGAAKLAGLDW